MNDAPVVVYYNFDAGNYGVYQKDEDGQTWVVLFSCEHYIDACLKRNQLMEKL